MKKQICRRYVDVQQGSGQEKRKRGLHIRLAVFGALAVLLLLTAVFSGQLTPYDPYIQDLNAVKLPPSAGHLLGTDRFGRDMLSRVIAGIRVSIFTTLLLVGISAAFGTAVGVLCGWHTGAFDAICMRISDMFLAFPKMVLALAVAGMMGGGLQNAVIALSVVSWPKYARLARSQTLVIREELWMDAARLSGSSDAKLLCAHVLPNIMGTILTTAMADIGTMMMELAALGFLGLGVKAPAAEWGSMMSDARGLMAGAPWTIYAPGGAIFVTVMIFNLLGDAVRDYMDPGYRRGAGQAGAP